MIELLQRFCVAEGMTSLIPIAVSRFAPLRCSDGASSSIPFAVLGIDRAMRADGLGQFSRSPSRRRNYRNADSGISEPPLSASGAYRASRVAASGASDPDQTGATYLFEPRIWRSAACG